MPVYARCSPFHVHRKQTRACVRLYVLYLCTVYWSYLFRVIAIKKRRPWKGAQQMGWVRFITPMPALLVYYVYLSFYTLRCAAADQDQIFKCAKSSQFVIDEPCPYISVCDFIPHLEFWRFTDEMTYTFYSCPPEVDWWYMDANSCHCHCAFALDRLPLL